MRLLIVFRDLKLAKHTAVALNAAGFGTDAFSTIEDASIAMWAGHYEMVIVERRLDDGDAVAWLRGQGCNKLAGTTFVIVLADKEEERVAALEAGADDSAISLISMRELVARIRAVLRRPRMAVESRLTLGDLSLCTVAREASVDGRSVRMQRRQTAILEVLLRRSGQVVPRPLLEQDIYGLQAVCPNSLEVRISRLRRQLAEAGSMATIETVRGIGYRITAPSQPSPRN